MKIKQTLNRIYVKDIEQTIEFYERIFQEKCNSRFQYPQMNLEIARVGSVLIVSGSDEALKPFKNTQATFLVDSVTEFREFLLNNGATIISDLKIVPTGMNMTIKHLDGLIVEYVEHKNES